MASGTVTVRLADEALVELQRRATAEKKKVSDLARELVATGLQRREQEAGEVPKALIEHLNRLEKIGIGARKAALKAQFLANMSASFAVDLARLATTGRQPSNDEKGDFMAQMDGWADSFAEDELNTEAVSGSGAASSTRNAA